MYILPVKPPLKVSFENSEFEHQNNENLKWRILSIHILDVVICTLRQV
jgi:hypothetical protein